MKKKRTIYAMIAILGILILTTSPLVPAVTRLNSIKLKPISTNTLDTTINLWPEQDTALNQLYPDENSGDFVFLLVASYLKYPSTYCNQRSLLQFNINIPSEAIIYSAILELYMLWAPYYESRLHGIYRITNAWDQYTATWNNQPSFVPDATDKIWTGTTNMSILRWTVTSDVQGFVDGDYTNYGWVIKDEQENGTDCHQAWFYSSDIKDDYWPRLIITYNTPPNKPDTPSGPTSGTIDTPYPYQTSAIDPEGDKIEYGWDWTGNGVVDQWDNNGGAYYTSGVPITTSHSWPLRGTYNVKVVTKDIHGVQGPWSDPLTVNIKKGKNRVINTPFQWFLQSHPNLFPILRHLLRL